MSHLIDFIEGNFAEYNIEYRIHSTQRMFQRNIDNEDIEHILIHGDVIERYDEDFPFPSLLLNGRTSPGRLLHVVVGINNPERILIIITTYEPDPLQWTEDFSRRLP